MKGKDIIKEIYKEKMPDIRQVKENCFNQSNEIMVKVVDNKRCRRGNESSAYIYNDNRRRLPKFAASAAAVIAFVMAISVIWAAYVRFAAGANIPLANNNGEYDNCNMAPDIQPREWPLDECDTRDADIHYTSEDQLGYMRVDWGGPIAALLIPAENDIPDWWKDDANGIIGEIENPRRRVDNATIEDIEAAFGQPVYFPTFPGFSRYLRLYGPGRDVLLNNMTGENMIIESGWWAPTHYWCNNYGGMTLAVENARGEDEEPIWILHYHTSEFVISEREVAGKTVLVKYHFSNTGEHVFLGEHYFRNYSWVHNGLVFTLITAGHGRSQFSQDKIDEMIAHIIEMN